MASYGPAQVIALVQTLETTIQPIEVPDPQVEGLYPDQYKVISQKVSYQLAQRPGSYVILKHLRSVTKRVDTQAISCAHAPVGSLRAAAPT
jgi:transposase